MSMGIELDPGDIAYRCNLVTVQNGIMVDFSAGHISSPEGSALLLRWDKRFLKSYSRPASATVTFSLSTRGTDLFQHRRMTLSGKRLQGIFRKGVMQPCF